MSDDEPNLIEASDPNGHRYAYLILGELGEGSFSQVRLAERRVDSEAEIPGEQRLGRVVLKIAKTRLGMRLLAAEARVLLAIRAHADTAAEASRVVRIRGDGSVLKYRGVLGEQALIELEYLDGETMARWMEKTWFTDRPSTLEDVRQATGLALELARALAEIRRVGDGVLHRDIKPDNVMLTSAGLRLFDFNVSREDTPDERTLTKSVGSGDYMAPEVRLGAGYDQRADLYSFGVVLFELLTRQRFKPPWKGVPRDSFQVTLPVISALEDAPERVRKGLGELVGSLIVDQERRTQEPSGVVSVLDGINQVLDDALARCGDAALAGYDLIQLVGQLRPEGLLSVVADSPGVAPAQKALRRRLQVDDPLEEWLFQELRAAVARETRTLIVLAGNAGDGKSHLIERLLHHRMADDPELTSAIAYIADATHADRPDESQVSRLERFFAPLAPAPEGHDEAGSAKPVRLIAMNTGMVLRFFEEAASRRREGTSLAGDLDPLFDAMQFHLGLRQVEPPQLNYTLVVVNLDLRDPIHAASGATSFFERMLERLNPDAEDGLLIDHWSACESCPARQVCSVHFNIEALREPRVRRAVIGLLERASLDPEVHLSPRLLWSFIYRLVTGGLSRYALEAERASPCEVVRRRVEDHGWLLASHFTEVPFAAEGLPDVPLWRALRRLDPALSAARALDDLHTRFAIQTYRDDSDEEIAQLGGGGGELAGLSIKRLLADDAAAAERRDAAVRRRVFFDGPSYRAYADWGAAPRFTRLVAAYDAYSRHGAMALDPPDREVLLQVSRMVADVFLLGAGKRLGSRKFLRVSQPNPDADTHLLVEVDEASMNRLFKTTELIRSDLHVRAHRDRPELLEKLGYHAKVLTLVVGGRRLVVDLELYEFLEQVEQGRQPSRRDLGQFEALLFLGEHLGNTFSRHRRDDGGVLFVFHEPTKSLHRLAQDDFGVAHVTREMP